MLVARGTDDIDEELFLATRPTVSSAWSAPNAITDADIPNAGRIDTGGAMGSSELVLYFLSDRTGGSSSAMDLFTTSRAQTDSPFGPIRRIDELSEVGMRDADPWVSPDERYIVFSRGDGHLYEARR